ncbi:MarR family winged helix-turn-helix transcriptional regulator [Microbispora sp. ATCC PTA-5024]|uniref:MarR family winged helix-turn-helix transcriptional regulator n=1 Tax=Microbispora sp. ATCC PTA-5024 TaxID=316330 RepID=UPI0004022088|nr:MarR family transcriptional regulator [Microbispora sp. ATCC PTA-5024]
MDGDGREAPAGAGPLAASTCWLLGDAAREVAQGMEKALEGETLRRREYGVLVVLEADGPLSQQEIGRRLAIDRSTMVHVVDVLEGRGLVARTRDRADRRAYSIALTGLGRAFLADVLHPAAAAVQDRLMERLSREDRTRLNRILAQLVMGT